METIVTEGECTHLFYTETHSLHKRHCRLNEVRNPEKHSATGAHASPTPTGGHLELAFPRATAGRSFLRRAKDSEYVDDIPSPLRKMIMLQVSELEVAAIHVVDSVVDDSSLGRRQLSERRTEANSTCSDHQHPGTKTTPRSLTLRVSTENSPEPK